jgi:tRNA A-37 threonylcarbamoyl transferase component Bud32
MMERRRSSSPDIRRRGGQQQQQRRQRRRRRSRGGRRAAAAAVAGGSPSSDSDARHPPVAADVPPRAGVVSVEDDGAAHAAAALALLQQHERQQQQQELKPETRKAQAPPPPASSTKTKKRSASSSHDDNIGHFKGREGVVISDRYRVIKEVGVGTFGRVLECLDLKRTRSSRRDRQENNVVAIKIVRNVKRYYESALIEADIVEEVNRRGGRGVSHCAVMFDSFSFSGHYCMVFEKLGPSLYDFLKRQKYRPFPLMVVRDFAKQLLETLEFLHSFRLIHTDLKPENVLLMNGREVSYKGHSIPECTRIKVIDFGGATYDNEKKSSVVNTRQYRAPEVILGVGWSMPSDLWSVGKNDLVLCCTETNSIRAEIDILY